MVDTSTLVLFLGGPFLSLLISWILGQGFDRRTGAMLAFGACLLVSTLTTLLMDGFVAGDTHDPLGMAKMLATNFAAVAFTAYGSYERVWKPFGVSDGLNARGPQKLR